MGILIDPTPPRTRHSGKIKPAIEAVQKIFAGKYIDATFKVYDAIIAERSDDEELGQRAWTLWRESLALTLEIFFETAYLTRKPADQDEFDRLMATVLNESAQLVREDRVDLSVLHLVKPSDFPLYQALRERLPDLARLVAPDHLRSDPELQRRLDRAFAAGFYQARVNAKDHFRLLTQALAGSEGDAMRRWDEWRRYYAEFLRWGIEDKLLFGQSEGGPSLRDIFVDLRCYWRERPEPPVNEKEDHDKMVTAHVSWLGDTLKAWLYEKDQNDLLRIVTGGPGCGKSSSAEMLALEVARDDRYDVYLVQLQGLDVTRAIPDIVAQHVRRVQTGGKGLSESPIDWLPLVDKPLFLIFDGLDEVARPDGAGPEVTRKFVASLRTWLHDSHRQADSIRAKALTLGRPLAAEAAADEISLGDSALLHVAPLFRLDEERCKRRKDADLVLSGPEELIDPDHDQRKAFWKKWADANGLLDDEAPEALSEPKLEDLTIEPLLLYLLIYSGYASDHWQEAAENRNRLYQAIFEQVHDREIEKKKRTEAEGLIKDRDDFFILMECLGLAAWRGGGRTGDTEQFKLLRDKIYAPEKSEAFQDVTNADLDNVALQFYTHISHGERAGYAFIHKSFGEYLTARALIVAGNKWMKRFAGIPADFAKAWLQLIGQERLTSDILAFMIEETRLRVKPKSESRRDLRYAREKVRQLEKVAQTINQDGFPAHDTLEGLETPASTWRSRELLQRNAEEALYGLIHAWAEAGYPFNLLEQVEECRRCGWTTWAESKIFKDGHGPKHWHCSVIDGVSGR